MAGGQLLGHLLRFARALRQEGVLVTPDQVITFAEALSRVPLEDRATFHAAARATLICRHEDLVVFERVFEVFWLPLKELTHRALTTPKGDYQVEVAALGELPQQQDKPILQAEKAMTYSASEALRHKDFEDLSERELEMLKRLLLDFDWRLPERRTRRVKPKRRGKRLDLPHTLRRAMRQGGEVLSLRWQQPQTKPRPLIVLLDISGSMERYARLLLIFLYALSRRQKQGLEAFVFGTRLTRVTPALKLRDVDAALASIGQEAQDWSGGTRIGESLGAFHRRWGRRLLKRGAVVLIVSDGWDQGEPGVLRREIARLQRHTHRLVWLNPFLGTPGYAPRTRGMQAALPYIDDFLPVHNLRSLEELAAHLETLPSRRPLRRALAPAA